MQNVRYSVMYKLTHPETGRVLTNADSLEALERQYMTWDTTKNTWKYFTSTERKANTLDATPDCICTISKEVYEFVYTYKGTSGGTTDYYFYALKPIQINIPNAWCVYNTYQSLTDCAKAVEKLAHVFGAENLKIVKEVDHRLLFQIG